MALWDQTQTPGGRAVAVTPEAPCGSASPSRGHRSEPLELEVRVWGGWGMGEKSALVGSLDCQETLPDCCSFKYTRKQCGMELAS